MISNKEQFTEKRKHIRFSFSSPDRVFGGFSLPEGSEETVSLRILDCSAGGLQYTIARDKERNVGVGSIVTLHHVEGSPVLESLSLVRLKVRWISDNPVFADIVVGCEFIDIAEEIKQKINQLVGTQQETQEVIFCEECGTKKIVDRETIAGIDKHPLVCHVCNYMISRETIIAYSSNVNTRDRSSLHLLLIDDNLGNLLTMTAMLKKKYIVTMAPTGKRGLELAERTVPDLILLDVVMPEMGGFEVCASLKANPKTRNIPVVFITAKSLEDDEYLFVGAVDYITKPVNRQLLEAVIRIQLQSKLLQDAHDKQIAELENEITSLRKKYLEAGGGQEVIRQEKKNIETILDAIDVIVIIQSNEKKIVWANRNALTIFETTLTDVIGKPCYTLLQDTGASCAACPLSAGGIADYSKPVEVYNDRLNRLFSQSHLPLFDDDGELTGVAHLIKIKTSVKSEESLSSPDRNLSANFMELNDIISAILIGSDTVRNKYKDDASLGEVNEYIGEAANRLRVMLNDLQPTPDDQ